MRLPHACPSHESVFHLDFVFTIAHCLFLVSKEWIKSPWGGAQHFTRMLTEILQVDLLVVAEGAEVHRLKYLAFQLILMR